MFNRKLSIAAIAASSLFFIAASPGMDFSTPGDMHYTARCVNDTAETSSPMMHAFDENGLCICVPELAPGQVAEVPVITLNKQARQFVADYNKVNGFYLQKIKRKSEPFFNTMDKVFQQFDIPQELRYLAVIESKLDTKVVSPAGAVGLWQLMAATGKTYGLKVGGKNDERKHAYKSTVAAAKCIKALHKMFDDWLLVVAAYNCGPGGVFKAIKRSGSRDFWVLQQFLPAETRKHVKRFIAMHYYFEGHGSLATLTKKETKAHIDAVAQYTIQQAQPKADTLSITTEIVRQIK